MSNEQPQPEQSDSLKHNPLTESQSDEPSVCPTCGSLERRPKPNFCSNAWHHGRSAMPQPEQSDSRSKELVDDPVYLTAYERRLLDWAISTAPWRFFNPGPMTDSALLSASAKLRGGHPAHRRTRGWVDNLCRWVRHLVTRL